MKKMFVAFGIAIAIFVSAFAISTMNANEVEAAKPEPEPVSIEEAVTNYLVRDYTEGIKDLEIFEIVPIEQYGGGYYVNCHYYDAATGNGYYHSINMGVLGDIEF